MIQGIDNIAKELLITKSQVVIFAKMGREVSGHTIEKTEADDGAIIYMAHELREPTAGEGASAQESEDPPAPKPETEELSSPASTEAGEGKSDGSEVHAEEAGGDEPSEDDSVATKHTDLDIPKRLLTHMEEWLGDYSERVDRLIHIVEGKSMPSAVAAVRKIGKGIGQTTAEFALAVLEKADLWHPVPMEKADDLDPYPAPEPKGLHLVCPTCDTDYGYTGDEIAAYSDSACTKCKRRFIVQRLDDGTQKSYVPESEHEVVRESSRATEPEPVVEEGVSSPLPVSDDPLASELPEPQPIKDKSSLIAELPECYVLGDLETHSPEWHRARSHGIGSSDVGAILGVSDFGNIVDVWRAKVDPDNREKHQPWLDEYRSFGTFMEPYLISHLEDEHGIAIATAGSLGSGRWPIAQCNLDAYEVGKGVLEEIKTSENEWDDLPDSHYAQVQHQMLVTGAKLARIRQFISPVGRKLFSSMRDAFGSLREFPFEDEADDTMAAWLIAEGKIVTWVVERDDDYILRMYNRLLDFWEHVVGNIEPEIVPPEGEVDLSGAGELAKAFAKYADIDQDTKDFRGIIKRRDAHKKKVKKMIEREISLLPDSPKRVRVGVHTATLVVREYGKASWTLYPKKKAES